MDDYVKLKKSLRNMQILVVIVIGLVVFSFAIDFLVVQKTVTTIEENLQTKPLKTSYVVQNLKGDAMETWYAWQPRDKIEIKIVGENNYPTDKIDAIKRAILSTETIEIDNNLVFKGDEGTSTYWIGWKGAVDHIREKRGIEKPLDISFTDKDEADIIITLTNSKSGEGLSGITNSLVNDEAQTILRSFITIYESDKLSNEHMEIIIRHEFGHVAGLAHATAPEDLMYPVIQTPAPYISECDVDALLHLYTGGKTSQVICES
ncbi:MAG: matrixin family metalloprotease [Nitrosopumilaceae archaeon]|nr:matrixin family metalloprotease [Nitrosopumilaceae archaeon]NIP10403.1 matrixin family metalloprotease [Nitrosopumilaceae archaeon]NIS95995.1 matrixin family metalloprotease [Nitrosopumilaceae archaeon]